MTNKHPNFDILVRLMLDLMERAGGCTSGRELLEMIWMCGNAGIPLPSWIVADLFRRLKKVETYEVSSWDDVFDQPFAKHSSMSKLKHREIMRLDVYVHIRQIVDANPAIPIDVALFERVGRKFKIGKTKCAELYYEQEHRLRSRPRGDIPMSRDLFSLALLEYGDGPGSDCEEVGLARLGQAALKWAADSQLPPQFELGRNYNQSRFG
jgi:hypothetical protein